MDGIDVIVISILSLLIILLLEIQKRDEWVYEIKLEWNQLVSEYRTHILGYGAHYYKQMDEIYTHRRMINIMYSYTLILLMFWKKDLKSCIKPISIDLFE